MKGNVYRVDKLLFVPLIFDSHMKADSQDQPYIDMIQHVNKESSFYFSYDIDLTKNIQKTCEETQLKSLNPSGQ